MSTRHDGIAYLAGIENIQGSSGEKHREAVVRLSIGTLRSNDADVNENVKKKIGFIRKTTTVHVHHAFLYIS